MPFSHRHGSLAALGLILITIVPVTAEGPPLPLQILGRLFVVPSGHLAHTIDRNQNHHPPHLYAITDSMVRAVPVG